jgi:hypothetical protein
MKIKTPNKSSKYYIEAPFYRHAVSWCLCYWSWKDLLSSRTDSSKAIRYDVDKVQTSGNSDPTMEIGTYRAELQQRIDLIEKTVEMVAPEIYTYLLEGVTVGLNFYQLENKGMPCSANYYYSKRQQFYYEIAKTLNFK